RGLADGHHAGGLARGRAEPAGELGEVVGGVQPLGRARPVAAPDEIVPFRDEVPQRAAVVAERDAAVHAAPGLRPDDRQQAPPVVDLIPVPDPIRDGPLGAVLARGGEEALRVGHSALQRQEGWGAGRRCPALTIRAHSEGPCGQAARFWLVWPETPRGSLGSSVLGEQPECGEAMSRYPDETGL